MFKRIISSLAFFSLFIYSVYTFGGCVQAAQTPVQQTSKSAVITVPAGEIIPSVLTSPVNSSYLMRGHIVTMVITEDYKYNNKVVIPSDSIVYGSVISVNKAIGNESSDNMLLRFTQIVTPTGIQIPIAPLLKTEEISGLLQGSDECYDNEDGHIKVAVGTSFDLLLTQPITVNPEVYRSNY